MNKISLKLLASGTAFILGNVMFYTSFYQKQERILVSPYSTQQAVQITDIPQPYQALLRFGGCAIALSSAVHGGLTLKEKLMGSPYPVSTPQIPTMPQLEPEPNTRETNTRETNTPEIPTTESEWTELEDTAPTKPLLDEIAEYLVSPDGGHLLIASGTGTGKTSTLLALMAKMIEIAPETQFHVIDPKGTVWGGLSVENIIEIDLVNPDASIQRVLDLFDSIKRELQLRKRIRQAATIAGKPYKVAPIILIIDEYLALLQAARECSQRRLDETIAKILETFAFFCREDAIKLLLVSQSPLVTQLGFNTAVRSQFALLCQGIGSNSQSFKPIIMALNSDEFRGGNLLQTFYGLCKQNPSRPVAFSSLGATGRVELLPDLTGIKMRRIFSPPPPPTEETEAVEPEPGAITYLKDWLETNGLKMEDLNNG